MTTRRSVSDRPILFSAPMVRAILEGRKTQTRRIIDPQPVLTSQTYAAMGLPVYANDFSWPTKYGTIVSCKPHPPEGYLRDFPLRYAVGDLLWVREAWKPHSIFDHLPPREMPESKIFYLADPGYSPSGSRGRPGMHMPRWASRITLRVTGAKVERLQDISEADAIAEGVESDPDFPSGIWRCYEREPKQQDWWGDPRESFRTLWESINGPGSWDANPWVAAYSFEPIFQNVDKVAA